jgi:hypothetical protein
MKVPAGKSRAKHPPGRKPVQSAPLTGLIILDALRSWVIPSAAAAVGLVVFVLYNVELLEQAFAVTAIGALALLVVLFYGLRGFAQHRVAGRLTAVLIAFALLWSAATFYPFYRAINPGTPVYSTTLSRSGGPVTLPLHERPGRYSIVVEGHFLPSQGHQNRTARFSIALGRGGSTDRMLEGTFSQEWGSQRVGAGRRSSLVPVMHQSTQALDEIDDPDGRDLTVKLTDLSPEVGNDVNLRLYAEEVPRWVLLALGGLTVAGAVLIDAWRPKGTSEGLMVTLTTAALVGIVVFRASAAAAPGFPQLAIAALLGTLVGALGSSLLWRMTQPLRRYLPARP